MVTGGYGLFRPYKDLCFCSLSTVSTQSLDYDMHRSFSQGGEPTVDTKKSAVVISDYMSIQVRSGIFHILRKASFLRSLLVKHTFFVSNEIGMFPVEATLFTVTRMMYGKSFYD